MPLGAVEVIVMERRFILDGLGDAVFSRSESRPICHGRIGGLNLGLGIVKSNVDFLLRQVVDLLECFCLDAEQPNSGLLIGLPKRGDSG